MQSYSRSCTCNCCATQAAGAEQLACTADGLQESLLGEDYSSSSGPVSVSRPHQQQLIVHQPFSVDAFIRCVVESWLALLSKCNSANTPSQHQALHVAPADYAQLPCTIVMPACSSLSFLVQCWQQHLCALLAGTLSRCLQSLLGGGSGLSLSLVQVGCLDSSSRAAAASG